ncbi:unnamed protein product [Trifolium pratense]|uniref:Uncharacterized protein n=1 Tax=Trifolium pratense TaxID=57577 RepID=A0ACB0IYH3_TRIPR|nr:unnamed protein product [Trifolium pratense]
MVHMAFPYAWCIRLSQPLDLIYTCYNPSILQLTFAVPNAFFSPSNRYYQSCYSRSEEDKDSSLVEIIHGLQRLGRKMKKEKKKKMIMMNLLFKDFIFLKLGRFMNGEKKRNH